MLYVIWMIIVSVIIAAVIGFIVGWLLRARRVTAAESAAREEADRLGKDLSTSNAEIQGLTASARDVEKTNAELRKDLLGERSRREDLAAALNEANGRSEAFGADLAAEKERASSLEAELVAARSGAENLEGELATARRELDTCQKRSSQLDAELVGLRADGQRHSDRISELERELAVANEQRNSLEAERDTIRADTDRLAEELSERTRHAEELEQRHREERLGLQQELVDVRGTAEAEMAETKDRLESERSRVGLTGTELEHANRRIAELEATLTGARERSSERDAEIAEARRNVGELEQRTTDHRALAIRLESDLESSRTRLGDLEAEAEGRDAELKAAHDRITVLQSELGATAADLRQARDRQPPASPGPGVEKGEAAAAVTARFAAGADVEPDDLKVIKGIGPKLESLLNELNITAFSQVAGFTPEDVELVTAALDAFKGRIERDDWIGGARHTHAEKYGEPL